MLYLLGIMRGLYLLRALDAAREDHPQRQFIASGLRMCRGCGVNVVGDACA